MPSGDPTRYFDSAPTPTPRPALWRRLIAVGGWGCLVLSVGLWGLLRAADSWPAATVVMFAPLHLLALLPGTLLLVAAIFHRRALRTLAPAFLVTAGPVAGFCVPWTSASADALAGPRVRVLTCNAHYSRIPVGPLDRLVTEARPDVVVLQEWNSKNHSEVLIGPEWHVHRDSGHFLASRYPIRRAESLGNQSAGTQGSVTRYALDTRAGAVTLFSVHLASPRDGLSEVAKGDTFGLNNILANSELRWIQSRNLADWAGRVDGPVVLAGDFNTPPHSDIFRQVWGGYESAFTSAGWGWGHTFIVRVNAVRIDHILVGSGGHALECWVGPPIGSPHRPVIADVAWPAGESKLP
ncbi:endonuclease/exonuclease/phosphatase family protein [Gemmata sp. G18]|uniref:Endonuclease/exonuclease/phosphatase family protein n=1 Tax=Gemmata palustris TaxID=2822762 RepID=A0ABS5C380_9BACT|nr:endonuclease/exonuclease/phosphatase family protein [Gemmata palustris]MBP3960451.1 endonuclease/exonuclease/phosphatase family protein [Gemmata palustris]